MNYLLTFIIALNTKKMKQRDNNYHVQIKPEFLFDKYKIFSNNYTNWVYVSIKHNYEYFLQHAPYKLFNIDVNSMAAYYATTPATIYDAIDELVSVGLLERNKRKFRLIDESEYVSKFGDAEDDDWKKLPDFIKIYQNAYDDLLLSIKKEILPMGSNRRLIVKCLKIYYYLMAFDRHCLLKNEPIVKSELSQTSIEKKLGIDHKVVKFLLSVLNDRGYIKLEDGKIFTLNKDLYDPNKHTFKKPEYDKDFEKESAPTIIKKDDSPAPVETKVPDSFIGYFKSDDGKWISIIYYSKKYKSIMLGGWCNGDGIPPTFEEYNIGNELVQMGKRSQYYKPENFWMYKPLKAA